MTIVLFLTLVIPLRPLLSCSSGCLDTKLVVSAVQLSPKTENKTINFINIEQQDKRIGWK